MAKKLSDIKNQIESSEILFYEYLMQNEDALVMNLIIEISKRTKVFIFSGVIRNFFLEIKNNRDIDIILEKEIDIFPLLGNSANVSRNSFGGFKIIYNKNIIDLWFLEDTWALKKQGIFSFDLEKRIPGTAFFNFSAVVYSFNDKRFHYENNFVRFLYDKQIDVVYDQNPNYKLCVLNTLYYSDKYNLNIKRKLKNYVIKLYNENDKNYSSVQLKHLGYIKYPDYIIQHRIETILKYKKKRKKSKIKLLVDTTNNI